MKKLFGIIIFALLVCDVVFAKEYKVYHKDENSISIERGWTRSKQHVIAANHCAQYGKFAFQFKNSWKYGAKDEKGKNTYLYHCSKQKLSKSPISGSKLYWTNHDPFHEFTQEEKIEKYKTTCVALGFKIGTEKLADCTLKLMMSDKDNSQKNNQTGSTQTGSNQTQGGIDWGKVAEEFNPDLKDKNKRKCTKTASNTIVCEDTD